MRELPLPTQLQPFGVRRIVSQMTDDPAAYILAALSSLGVDCRSVRVTRYDPASFGNLLAEAETDRGGLQITYDRGFSVELSGWSDDSISAGRITEALEKHKIAITSGS